MPVTKDQAHMLASLALACRPHGAPRWDAPGVVAAIEKVARLELADVTMAVMRAASDRDLKTPGAIGNTASSCWREKVAERTAPRPPKPGEHCRRCGKHADACWCVGDDGKPCGPTRTQGPTAYEHDRIAAVKAQIRRPSGGTT